MIVKYRGRCISQDDITTKKKVIDDFPDSSRRFISQEICRIWDWRWQNGFLKDVVCRNLLLLLESVEFIKLPPRKCTPNNPLANRKKPEKIVVDETPFKRKLSEYRFLWFRFEKPRSPKGRMPGERLLTVIATCALQGRSAFNFILSAVSAFFNGRPASSLIPGTSWFRLGQLHFERVFGNEKNGFGSTGSFSRHRADADSNGGILRHAGASSAKNEVGLCGISDFSTNTA